MAETRTRTTPGEVFTQAMAAVSAGDLQGWMALCRDDIVIEFPFAPPGRPRRLEGKAAVEQYMRTVPAQIEFEEVANLEVHQTVDPQTAVIEMTAKGRVKATGAPYEMSYVVVLKTIDGQMALYRDYWNPLVVLDLLESP
ncbi:nuclear transport factor 2 family protein [Mycobacterium sp. URHB0044]|uniref:nuclear transport factor 2 family protein n=1 Tax=Mycobacterium sp. URHB0044 TaxID=1380386 RepID=UPI0004920CC6|nr:nuclear transport factor 2 family protein [Mycobacterium sp. URHB0044]